MTRAFFVTIVLAAAVGCGSDYTPSETETSGRDAAPLGRVYDLDVSLPHVVFGTGQDVGVLLDVRLQVQGAFPGSHEAAVSYGDARVGGRRVPVEDLSSGTTTLLEDEDTWSTTRIGPIRVEGTTFEYTLSGAPEDQAWVARGDAQESQTALGGSFEAWRRHRFLAATTDFGFGGTVDLVELRRESEIVVRANRAATSSDPFLRARGGAVYVVDRLSFDRVTRLDPGEDFEASWQAGVASGSNPHDIAHVAEDKAYVSRYEPPFDDLRIVDPRGGASRGSVELGALADNDDATPRADRMAQAAGLVFVGLQDIDRTFTDYREGKLAVVDPALDEVVGLVRLGGKNPGALEVLGRGDQARLYVALGGIFEGLLPQELSGGVAVVDPFNLALERWALDDDDAGGNVGALAMASDRLGYVAVSDRSFVNRVLAFDPSGGEVLREIFRTDNLVPELEIDGGGLLAVPDRDFASPRLCLYRAPRADPLGGAETFVGCARLPAGPASIEALD